MFNYVSKPVYYWSRYWQKWDEVLGWNPHTNYIIVKDINTDYMREHCTQLDEDCLSLKVINRNDYFRVNDFYDKIKETCFEAYDIIKQCGVPERMFYRPYKY